MPTYLTKRGGEAVDNPTMEDLRTALAELDEQDPEHLDCWLIDEAGWGVGFFQGGGAMLENIKTNEGAWHMQQVSHTVALAMWQMLMAGNVESVKSLAGWAEGPWKPGPAINPEQMSLLRDRLRKERLVLVWAAPVIGIVLGLLCALQVNPKTIVPSVVAGGLLGGLVTGLLLYHDRRQRRSLQYQNEVEEEEAKNALPGLSAEDNRLLAERKVEQKPPSGFLRWALIIIGGTIALCAVWAGIDHVIKMIKDILR